MSSQQTTDVAAKQTLGFQAEVRQLLQLMIHSLYSNREIFLRELISNASDALDRLRFESIAQPALMEGHAKLAIEVACDRAARTITVSDNGIGMSRQDAVEHLGTIAKSGTREFFAQLTGDQQKDAQLIGQFGVGFYSSFIVADRVTVVTRRAGHAEAVRWESDGAGEFSVEPAERASAGTDVILHLREGEDELLDGSRLRSIVGKYSDHISAPIRMRKETWDKDKGAMVASDERETVNQASALWTRAKSDISDAQYQEFYRHVSHDFGEPLAWTHGRVEGRTEYTQLLYLPARAQYDLWDRNHRHGIRLYVRRVFIMDDAEQLMPPYLRFVRGVIDSNDLPLNVSREILQESRDVKAIRDGATRRVLSLLEDLAENQKEKYAAFWSEFGQVLKEGVGDDPGNRDRIAALLRFATTADDSNAQTVSLKDYAARMKAGQDCIYYITADTPAAARSSPQLEIFRKKGIEVLLLSDRVDESEKAEQQKAGDELKGLVERVKGALGDRVKDVRISARLTESAACIVNDDNEMSSHLQRLLKAAGQKTPETRPVLELNPRHPLVARLQADAGEVDDWARLLLDEAVLAEGGQLAEPAAFVQRVNRLLLNDAAR